MTEQSNQHVEWKYADLAAAKKASGRTKRSPVEIHSGHQGDFRV